MIRNLVIVLACSAAFVHSRETFAFLQFEIHESLKNGDFEEGEQNGLPRHWMFSPSGPDSTDRIEVLSELSKNGKHAVSIDTMDSPADPNRYAVFSQWIDASNYRGKKVRFRAAVKVPKHRGVGRAQLWFRVDRPRKNNVPQMGAFDNMRDRPITNGEWEYYEIVGLVDEDAERIVVGMLVFPQAIALIDDASFELVDDSTESTASNLTTSSSQQPTQNTDLPQPFFNHWLWLVLIAFILFAVAYIPVKYADEPASLLDEKSGTASSGSAGWFGMFCKFGFRFSFVYWIAYSFPTVLRSILPYWGTWLFFKYQWAVDKVVRWFAKSGLKIEETLRPPGGSGDTTFSYVQVLICFLIAISVATIWSWIDWRKTSYVWLKDLLRSYLRYVLAITMLSYGLAKTGWVGNQFPEPDVNRLEKTYGSASPMNMLWTFMGASRPYTIFAGLGEVCGALLLLWRRTTILGALVVVGVVTNVVMLNFCYDVPVKQYSSHLLCMAYFILLPDLMRLGNLLILNRRVEPSDFKPPYTNNVTIWIQRVIKLWIIGFAIGWPIFQKIRSEYTQKENPLDAPGYFGHYEVESFSYGGELISADSKNALRWTRVAFRRMRWSPQMKQEVTDYLTIRIGEQQNVPLYPVVSEDGSELILDQPMESIPQEQWLQTLDQFRLPRQLEVETVDEDHILITGTHREKAIRVRLKRIQREDFLLVNRGFHWINEFPFNQ